VALQSEAVDSQKVTLSRTSRRRKIQLALIAGDSLAVLVATLLATWVRFGSFTASVAFETEGLDVAFWQLLAVVLPLWILFLALSGLYGVERITWGPPVLGSVAQALSLSVVALILLTFLTKMPGLSRGWTLLLLVFSVALVLIARATVAGIVAALRRRGRLLQRTLLVGTNGESADIIRLLRVARHEGLVPVGCLASSQAERLSLNYCSEDVPVRGTARDLVRVTADENVDTVIIASSAFDHEVIARMIAELRALDVDVHLSSGLFEVLTSRVIISEIAGVPLITVRGISLSRSNLVLKRAFDLTLATVGLLAGLPVWIFIALTIKLTSRGPILYFQTRVGRSGALFPMFKFRSMYVDADARLSELASANDASGPLFKMKNDPRVTSVGRWMRKLSIDEFPQLLNVLRGEMSLVGPRPPLPVEVERYSTDDWRRLEVVPGMTGLWQVSGRSNLTFDEMVRLDVFYIQNWSVALDIMLIARTVPAVLFARGAY
jgi:exopolysaccharide biosynthesis polyprenyl glycosylphosphotransferase